MGTEYRIEWDEDLRWICPICDEHNHMGYCNSSIHPETKFNLGFNPWPREMRRSGGGDRTRFECLRCGAHFYTERYLEDCTYTVIKSPRAVVSRMELLLEAC